ncbi:NAD-dependent epimerase/dehydratase family protein [Streptomyces sp. NPDC048473]|uniref:NAD-dependent epimerase/dehydratase family protein n=1 Tax=unclassified Streptomyces TaxID=2593676 RepID=UPI00371B391A
MTRQGARTTGSVDTTRILLTGAAGRVGTQLRPLAAREGRTLRLLDITTPPAIEGSGAEETVITSLTDAEALLEACRGVSAIVHLGGQSVESTLDDVLDRNVRGTLNLLEAARLAGVPRVVLASSTHTVGFHQYDGTPVAADAPARPDTLYGWSKAAIESAGRLYHDRFGMDIICLRIGSWFPMPNGMRGLSTWLSPADGHRLVEACLSCREPGYRIVWGVSRNTRGRLSLAEGEAIGYHPLDDAEQFAPEVTDGCGVPDPADPTAARLGGAWCALPLGRTW